MGGTLTASCTFSGVAVHVWDVHIAIGGNVYRGAADAVRAVHDPSLGFTTGGGTVVHNGVRANFGFTAKYLPSGSSSAPEPTRADPLRLPSRVDRVQRVNRTGRVVS